ncbi:MAG: hypothetical protein DMG07_24670, partial [Acidobacteria bacterium]
MPFEVLLTLAVAPALAAEEATMTRRSQHGWDRQRMIGALLVVALAAGAAPARAQVTTATLTGIVKDGTGAILPGVKVAVTHVETNLSREVYTNDAGIYRAPALNPGTYRVEAELPGFKKAVVTGIVLQVNQQSRLDLTLEIGQLTETVLVEGTASIVDTESPMIGGVLEQMRIVGLPLNGRNFMELTTLTAGINEGNSS